MALRVEYGRARGAKLRFVVSLITFALLANCLPSTAAQTKGDKPAPSGTLLIPIAPKIDTSRPTEPKPAPKAAAGGSEASAASAETSSKPHSSSKRFSRYAAQYDVADELKPTPENISAENGNAEEPQGDEIGEDTTLKGTIQLVADDTEYDQDKNTFLGTGNAVVLIAGEDSKLEADTILYDQNNQTIDARGNVRILRSGQLTTGSAFKFNVTSNEYLITNPDTEVEGATVIARTGVGSKDGLAFRNGTVQMPEPLHIAKNNMWGPLSSAEESTEKTIHPDAYLPAKPSFKFKARKMVYERYKEQGNLTVFGGRMMFGKFGIPVPKFEATVGQENSRVTFPVTPLIGNTMYLGGMSLGANFNRPVGKNGVFTVAPFVQIGGRSMSGTTDNTNSGKLGAGAKLGYVSDRLSAHLAYGSVSNLVVGDFKYMVNKNLRIQAGINRFLDDGMFGMRRARLLAEAVHMHSVGNIPFIASLTFRSSAGFAQDNSSLLNLTPQYAKLFDQPVKQNKTFALRVQEQIMASTHPIFNIGDDKYGAKCTIFGGIGLRGYSTGDAMLMAQTGPILNVYLNRARLQAGYMQSTVRGQSPFTFDQFIQGQRSLQLGGDIKISKFLTLGASTGYNLDNKLMYARSITAAVGPEDFKVLFSYDTIRKNNRYGFDLLYGQPIPFNKLVLKGSPDQGQLGGI